MVVRPKANLTQIFDNHEDLQFSKMFYDLSYKNTGLKSSEQQILAVLMDRMQLSLKKNHFDKVAKRFYVNMCNEEIHEITGDGLGTISSKMKKLSDLGYLDIVRRKNHSNNIYLNFYHTGSIYTNNDLEYHFYLSLNSKIEGRKFKNRKAEIQKSKTNHSTYSYLLYPEGNTNRTGASAQNGSSSDSNSNLSNKSSKAKNEQKNDESNSSQKQKQSQIENATNNSSSKDQVDIVTKEKLKRQQWLPKDSLETITTFVKERYSSQEAQVDVLGKICDKVLNAKDKASINDKAYKVLRWERNPYLVKEVNNKMHYWLTTAIMDSKKSWWGYFWKSLYSFFSSVVEETLSDKAPEPSKHSKNQKGSNGRKHIKEKKRDWAKDGYQRRVKFEDQTPEIQNLIANNWNKASWSELNNDLRYVEIDKNGLPYADSNGKFCKNPGAGSLEKIYDDTKTSLNKVEDKKKRDNFKAVKQFQENYKENAKNRFDNVSEVNKEIDQSSNNQQKGNDASDKRIDSKRKAELKEKLSKIDNPKNESKDKKEPKVYNQDKGDFEITPEMMENANNLDETSNDTSKNDKSPSEALADIGLE